MIAYFIFRREASEPEASFRTGFHALNIGTGRIHLDSLREPVDEFLRCRVFVTIVHEAQLYYVGESRSAMLRFLRILNALLSSWRIRSRVTP